MAAFCVHTMSVTVHEGMVDSCNICYDNLYIWVVIECLLTHEGPEARPVNHWFETIDDPTSENLGKVTIIYFCIRRKHALIR